MEVQTTGPKDGGEADGGTIAASIISWATSQSLLCNRHLTILTFSGNTAEKGEDQLTAGKRLKWSSFLNRLMNY